MILSGEQRGMKSIVTHVALTALGTAWGLDQPDLELEYHHLKIWSQVPREAREIVPQNLNKLKLTKEYKIDLS